MGIKLYGKTVMVEPVPKEQAIKLIIPEAAKESAPCDIIVRAVGPEVKTVKVGDCVVCRASEGKPLKFDNGDGVKLYSFFEEKDILGKF